MRDPTVLVLLLDVDDALDLDALRDHLPRQREGLTALRLSEFSPPAVRRFGPEKTPVSWSELGAAVVRLAARARELAKASTTPVEYYVAGRAPLPMFALLGAELSAWSGPITVLNRRQDSTWAAVPLHRVEASSGSVEAFFDVFPAPPAERHAAADGRLVVFVSCGIAPPYEAMRTFVRQHGGSVAHILELRTAQPRDLDGAAGAVAQQQLKDFFSDVPNRYPTTSGLVVFVAGPAQLAVLVGRAINPTILSDVWIPNRDGDDYELALTLPRRAMRRRELSYSAEARLARRDVLEELDAALVKLREDIDEQDLPPATFPMTEEDRRRVMTLVKQVAPLRELTESDEDFYLEPLRDEFSISSGLLEALRGLTPEERATVGPLFVLHEIFHVAQDLRTVRYHGIGRAAVALEEVEYWADAFAIGVLSRARIRNQGARGVREAQQLFTNVTQVNLRALVTFDKFFGAEDHIAQLSERRLRRYLVWHLQHARAQTITSPEDIWRLLGARIIVELAPLTGYLGFNFDKVVGRALADCTELCVVLDAKLMREPRSSSFDPARLLEAVRTFDLEVAQQHFAVVRAAHEELLVPWKAVPQR